MTTFTFVSAERGNHAVTTLCRVIGASVSGFYAWLRAIPTVQHHAEAEAELRGHIGCCAAIKVRTRDNQGEKVFGRLRLRSGFALPAPQATENLA